MRGEMDQDLFAEAGGQRLLPRRGAAELHVLAIRHGASLIDRALDAIGDERDPKVLGGSW
jgi:hypothetical protein